MCSLVHQLLLDNNALVSKLESGIRQAGPKVTENSSDLWNLFTTACQDSSSSTVCVFDALDECDPRIVLSLSRTWNACSKMDSEESS